MRHLHHAGARQGRGAHAGREGATDCVICSISAQRSKVRRYFRVIFRAFHHAFPPKCDLGAQRAAWRTLPCTAYLRRAHSLAGWRLPPSRCNRASSPQSTPSSASFFETGRPRLTIDSAVWHSSSALPLLPSRRPLPAVHPFQPTQRCPTCVPDSD